MLGIAAAGVAGLIKAVTRELSADNPAMAQLQPALSGPIALLTCPHLTPAYLSALFNVVDRALGHAPPRAPAAGQSFPAVAVANPRLVPLAAVLEGNRLLPVPQTRDVGRIGSLDQLRAQIVGLLSAPGQQLAEVEAVVERTRAVRSRGPGVVVRFGTGIAHVRHATAALPVHPERSQPANRSL